MRSILPRHPWLAWISLAPLVLVLGLLSACSGGGHAAASAPASESAAPPSQAGDVLNRPLPAAVATLPLIDEHGDRSTLADLRGKVVVLTDVLTTCQEVCPLVTANLRQIQRKAAAAGLSDRVEFVEITIDPQRDTPARLRAYQRLYRPGPNWESLTGTPQRLDAVWRTFGVARERVAVDEPAPIDWFTGKPSTYDVQHSDVLVFLDRRGRERYLIFGAPDAAGSRLPARMRRYLSAEGRRNLAHPDQLDWTVDQGLQALGWLLSTRIPA